MSTRGGVAWWRGEDLQKLHDRDGVFNHFTYSWGGHSPPLTWPPELPLSGTTHLHLRYLAHGIWVGEVVARGSELTPPYGRVPDRGFARVRQTWRRGEREGFIPQGTAFELIPVGLVHRNLEPEQWVLRIRNLPPADSRDPAGAPLKARKYLLTWRPKTTSWVLGDLTEEEGDAYRASAMTRGPPVPDMSALAQDHELDCLSVSPERYMDVRVARAKTQFPQEDPYQPRGGRREELRLIAAGQIPALPPPPPDRIYYAPPASQVPASSHLPTVLQDSQGNRQGGAGTAGETQQAHTPSTDEQQQQQRTQEGSSATQRPQSTLPAAARTGVSFYSQEARTAFAVEWGEETPQQGGQPSTGKHTPKAPPPKPPSSSEDEWPSEGDAPPEEDDVTMVQLGLSTCGRSSMTTSTSSTTTPRAESSRAQALRGGRQPKHLAHQRGDLPTLTRHHLATHGVFGKTNSLQEAFYHGGEQGRRHHARQQSQQEGGS